MKIGVTILVFLFALSAQAHEYFFAYAEMEYNQETKRYQGTIVVTTHDLEQLFDGQNLPPLEMIAIDDQNFEPFRKEINNGFRIISNGQETPFEIIGFEVYLTGISNFYIESEVVEEPTTLYFTFSLLMDRYQNQQNKLEFKMGDHKEYLHFIGESRKQKVKFEIIENE